nr:PREDICTED: uncharacterized protein LOC109043403 [Bemisia tabaci]
MENSLEAAAQHILTHGDVTGCLFADKHGLCLCAAGDAKPESSGLISAIAHHVRRLEPKSNPPTILLENDTQKCIIKQDTKITTAIFRKKNSNES